MFASFLPRLLLTAGLTASCVLPAVQAQETIKLTAAGGHPPVFLWVKLIDEVFIPEVDRRLAESGEYKVDWTRAWGGTLLKLGSESKGISDGVADLGFVSTVFEAAKFPMQNVSYVAPFGSDDIGLVTTTVADLQEEIPAMGEAWTRNGLVYLGGAALDPYHIWTNFPIRSIDDLKGKKINAPGPAANWIRDTGAVAVAGSLNTYYEDIKSGVSDGAIVFTTGAWGAKLHEVAPHITRVNFGAQYAGGLAMNKRRFDRLPAPVQEAFREAGALYSERFAEAQTQAAAQMMQQIVDAGGQVVELTPEERQRWANALPDVAQVWAADLDGKRQPGSEVLSGYVEKLRAAGTDLPRDWAKRP